MTTYRSLKATNQDRLWIEALKFDDRGLIPAIAQDAGDGTVLMMAWMNRDSIERTLDTGEVHYWSRSRQELWHKGATSGHIQRVKAMAYDCDADVILLSIEQVGNVACHTGARSCFFTAVPERAFRPASGLSDG
ncbi:MAG: phosphoribosyl-AMP cyclohydrolase [Geitlerinemataceae cyanobacterium]